MKTTKNKKAKTVNEVFAALGLRVSPTNFGAGRHGLTVDVFSEKYVGGIRLIQREDGEYSVSFEVADWLHKELADAGLVIHKRAKPTRKARSILQIARLA